MKRIIVFRFLIVSIFMGIIFSGCNIHTRQSQNINAQLQDVLGGYSQLLENELPDDLCLTIYYMSPDTFTPRPISADDMVSSWGVEKSGVEKIVIESTELTIHVESLKKLNFSVLQPVNEEPYVDARLYYVLESKETGKILEVTIGGIRGYFFVNGIQVEYNPVFFELIAPFVTEDFTSKWGDVTGDDFA